MKRQALSRIVLAGSTAIATAWSAGCGRVEVYGPDWGWQDWPWPGDQADLVTVTSEWRTLLAAGQQVEIKGVYGDIHALRTSGSDVVVIATKTGRRSTVDEVTIEVVPHGAGVTICAVYPDVAGRPRNSCEPGDGGNMSTWDGGLGQVRVAFTVELPDGVVLIGRTLTGEIDATNLRSDAHLSTLSGDIRVSTTRLATGRTTNGRIVASIGLPDWGRDLEFSSLNGDVDVTIPATTNAEVRATSSFGWIESDFPLHAPHAGALQGTLGSGGPTLHLSTLSGLITLRRGWQVIVRASHQAVAQ